MKKNYIAIALIGLVIIGYLVEAYAKIQWTSIVIANKGFTGAPGLIKLYILEAIPALIIYVPLGIVIYKIVKITNQIAYLIFILAVIPSSYEVMNTQWAFAEHVGFARKTIEYSKVILPMMFILLGYAIGKIVEKQPNKSL